jgi:peptidase E
LKDNMKRLFLASEAKHPESMKKLEEFVGGLKGKSIAYIPTAANGEEAYDTWQKGDTWKLVHTLGAKVELVLLEDYKDPRALDHLKGKDIIWVAGGMCGYLMYWMRRCQIEKHIDDLLESGAIYVGSSAGSMVCAKSLEIAEVYLSSNLEETFVGDNEFGASVIPGFGLIDFDFYPHYEDKMLSEIKKVWKGGDLYVLKNGEAITVIDSKAEVLGETRILREGKLLHSVTS